MRNRFPNILPNAPVDAKRVTRGNLDNAFNALLNIISITNLKNHSILTSAITITYNRIQVMFNENPRRCLDNLKIVRKWYIEYIRGNILGNPGLRAWEWDHIHEHPIFISPIIEILNMSEFNDKELRLFTHRVVIALLSLDRIMVIKGKPNYDTITLPGTTIPIDSDYYPKSISDLVGRLGFTPLQFRERFDLEVSTFKYTVLSSAGVNGDATWTAHSDARALLLRPDLLAHIKTFATEAGLGRVFKDLLSCIPTPTETIPLDSKLEVGRLHSFDEWGGKVRTVAIVDYWTQMLLTPLHNTINYFLKRIEADGTFNQEKLARRVQEWTATKDVDVFSYDLTAATDRLPISLQVDILSVLLDSTTLAKAWRNMLVDRDFLCSDGEHRRYARGQPMGARSSFPMLALTHHIIIQHAALLNKVDPFEKYVVLGDDMTLTSYEIASSYRMIMSHLGVPINLSKSVYAVAGCDSVGEICKRVYMNGQEITSISLKLIVKTLKNGSLAPVLQDDLINRGIKINSKFLTTFFISIVDKISFKELAILNSLPVDSSGMKHPVQIDNFVLADRNKWYPGLTGFSDDTINNVFVFTAAVEALKRLDALLRQTLAIGTAIAEKYGSFVEHPVDVVALWEILGIPTDVSSKVVDTLKINITSLSPCHPVIRASETEIERITELLSGLISVDHEMYNRARNGLMDIVRNALVDIWQDNDDARAAGGRTLLNKSLSNIKAMIGKGTNIDPHNEKIITYDKTKMVLDYSITLTQLQRQWVVRVGLDSPVTINAVKSRIPTIVSTLEQRASDALKGISI
nr:RNA-dependent RNA polymerase [Rhizophagus clarus mitovirus 3]